jgi:hypothetical protein
MKTKQNPIALNLPKIIALLILFGRQVVKAMLGNLWFPNPPRPLADVSANLDALENAAVTAQGGSQGAAAARDVLPKVVEDDLKELKNYAQAVTNKNPDKALAIIESAAMTRKQFPLYMKPDFEAQMGEAAEDVVLRVKSAGKRVAYEWESSINGGQTWIPKGVTTVAHISIHGITPGTVCLFRYRTTIKKTTGPWSQIFQFVAH